MQGKIQLTVESAISSALRTVNVSSVSEQLWNEHLPKTVWNIVKLTFFVHDDASCIRV